MAAPARSCPRGRPTREANAEWELRIRKGDVRRTVLNIAPHIRKLARLASWHYLATQEEEAINAELLKLLRRLDSPLAL